MRLFVEQLVEKAEVEYALARRELRARLFPNYDAACFHAQQCAEKYLKALLQEFEIAFPRTHDLEILLNLLLPTDATWEQLRPAAQTLSVLAVDIRYPGNTATRDRARSALQEAETIRAMVRQQLNLSVK